MNRICSRLPSPTFDESWSVEGLTKLRERVESFGIKLDMVPLPLSSDPDRAGRRIRTSCSARARSGTGRSTHICQMIRNAARAGIPALKYNLTLLGVVRTEPTPGRGGATCSTFVYDKAKQEPPLTEAGPVGADEYWERITYFLEPRRPGGRGVQGADGLPPARSRACRRTRAIRGVQTVLGSVDGLKRFVEHPRQSPYHGLNFCQGTVCRDAASGRAKRSST